MSSYPPLFALSDEPVPQPLVSRMVGKGVSRGAIFGRRQNWTPDQLLVIKDPIHTFCESLSINPSVLGNFQLWQVITFYFPEFTLSFKWMQQPTLPFLNFCKVFLSALHHSIPTCSAIFHARDDCFSVVLLICKVCKVLSDESFFIANYITTINRQIMHVLKLPRYKCTLMLQLSLLPAKKIQLALNFHYIYLIYMKHCQYLNAVSFYIQFSVF